MHIRSANKHITAAFFLVLRTQVADKETIDEALKMTVVGVVEQPVFRPSHNATVRKILIYTIRFIRPQELRSF